MTDDLLQKPLVALTFFGLIFVGKQCLAADVDLQIRNRATSSAAVVVFYTFDGNTSAEVRVPTGDRSAVIAPGDEATLPLDDGRIYVAVAFDSLSLPRATLIYQPSQSDKLSISQINERVWQIQLTRESTPRPLGRN